MPGRYAAFHKPPGVLVSHADPRGRRRLVELFPPELAGCFPVGRLDRDSEGLILVTDDGGFFHAVTRPGGCAKLYRVEFDQDPSAEQLQDMARGGAIGRGLRVAPCVVEPAGPGAARIRLEEGKNRQIRRLAARAGLQVRGLIREAVGPVQLGDLPPGGWKWLTAHEVEALQEPRREREPHALL